MSTVPFLQIVQRGCGIDVHKDVVVAEELYLACECFMEPHHVYMLQTIRKDIEQTESIIVNLTSRIKEVLSPYENVIDLLKKIPGLNRKTVEDLIAEIGLYMDVFPTEKHLASWAGMSPDNNESAGKKKLPHHHGNKHVKSILTEAAWAAKRTKNTFYNARYHRLAARRGNKRALIAIGHSILKSVWHVLKDACQYKELGAEYVTKKVATKRKAYLKKELEALGYKVSISKEPEIPNAC